MSAPEPFEVLFPDDDTVPKHARLDHTDRRLLAQLVARPRDSYAQLGEAVGLSRSFARRRLRRLIEGGLVSVHGLVDVADTEPGIGAFVLATSNQTSPGLAEIATGWDEAVWIVETEGQWNVTLRVEAQHIRHLADVLERIRSTPGVEAVEALTMLSHVKQNWLGADRTETRTTPQFHADAVDRQLAALLQRDGRASVTSLARSVGLSDSATRARVDRLLRSGHVRLEVMPGIGSIALERMFGLVIAVQGPASPVVERLVAEPTIGAVVLTAGRFAIGVEAWGADAASRAGTIERIERLPGVTEVGVISYRKGRRFFGDTPE